MKKFGWTLGRAEQEAENWHKEQKDKAQKEKENRVEKEAEGEVRDGDEESKDIDAKREVSDEKEAVQKNESSES
ncbi:hypothetical protein IAT40_005760 [Kwoniella sp. CBS 6097]